MKLGNKRVLVVGMARSGMAAAELLLRGGMTPVLSDAKKPDEFKGTLDKLRDMGCEMRLGEKPEGLLTGIDAVVISPGVPIDAPVVKAARERGIPVEGEMELAYSFLLGDVVAVTGTNGKTTTVTLIGKMLENAGRVTHVTGNIGYPLSSVALIAKKEDVSVVEVSSFQLESIKTFRPKVAALLNITEDHLNRHGTMAQYIKLKQRIFENQTASDIAVLNMEDPIAAKMAERIKARVCMFSRLRDVENGACVRDGKIVFSRDGETKSVCEVDSVLIPGPHNLDNALAATCAAACMGVPAPVIRHTLQFFSGVEHRIEKVRVIGGVTYINDSKGTNVDSTIKAVQSMKAPTVLLLGGYDKHADFGPLSDEVKRSGVIKHVVVMGQTAKRIAQSLTDIGYESVSRAYSMEDAVTKARELAGGEGNVLLSPACASFDMFRDYEQRGEAFKEIVNGMV